MRKHVVIFSIDRGMESGIRASVLGPRVLRTVWSRHREIGTAARVALPRDELAAKECWHNGIIYLLLAPESSSNECCRAPFWVGEENGLDPLSRPIILGFSPFRCPAARLASRASSASRWLMTRKPPEELSGGVADSSGDSR